MPRLRYSSVSRQDGQHRHCFWRSCKSEFIVSLTIRETVHDENQTAYLPLLRLLNLARTEDMTSEQTLDTAVELINEHQLLPELSTFNLALALHTAVPRIEAAYSWYGSNVDEAGLEVEGCGSWVEWRGKGYCESQSLSIAMEEGQRDM